MNTISQTENSVLMQQARDSLRGRWGLAVGVSFVYVLIYMVINLTPDHQIIIFPKFQFGIAHSILQLLLNGAMALGMTIFGLSLARRQNAEIAQIFQGFRRYGTAFAAGLFQTVFVLLWTLLLIIPGIIALLSYALTYFILADNPSMGALEAISQSKEMMRGNKWKLFCLGCRFLGWMFLCLLTLSVGFFWLIPYMIVSTAKFYEDVCGQESPSVITSQLA
jgi:uncharacterized membrane protein